MTIRRRSRWWLALAGVFAMVLTGCGEDSDTNAGSSSDTTEMRDMGEMDDMGGRGKRAGAADRIIEVRMLPGLRFDPATVDAKKGETITFKLKNEDDMLHEFMLGDEEMQTQREKEMMEMSDKPMDMDDEENAVTLEGGETKELTWTFEESGTVLYGCHQPGHYDEGMKGTITVT